MIKTQQNDEALLIVELHLLNYQQQQHLEQEFADYQQQFPKCCTDFFIANTGDKQNG
jgi:hypothetical protein